MGNTNSFDSNVFVDISAMNGWTANIKEIYTESTTVLNELSTLVESLNDSWQGTSATSFVGNYSAFIKSVLAVCDKMADFGTLLQTVVQTMERE